MDHVDKVAAKYDRPAAAAGEHFTDEVAQRAFPERLCALYLRKLAEDAAGAEVRDAFKDACTRLNMSQKELGLVLFSLAFSASNDLPVSRETIDQGVDTPREVRDRKTGAMNFVPSFRQCWMLVAGLSFKK